MPRSPLLAVVAAILFGVALVLLFVDSTIDPAVIQKLLFGGLTAFAASHI